MSETTYRSIGPVQIVATATLPMIAALLVTAFGLMERANVDRVASVYWSHSKARLPDVWYLTLIVFGVMHALGALNCRSGRLGLRLVQVILFCLPFVGANLLNLPVNIGYAAAMAAIATLIGVIVAVPVALFSAGASFGLLLYLPVYGAFGALSDDEPGDSVPSWKIYAGAGTFAAMVFCGVFGFDFGGHRRVGVGDVEISPNHLVSIWLVLATIMVLCCAGFSVGLTRFWEQRSSAVLRQFAGWFIAPVALAIMFLAWVIEPLSASARYREFAESEWPNRLSLFFRDHVPRKSEQLRFKQGEWLMSPERLVRISYQNGDASARRLEILPTLEQTELGLNGPITVSSHAYNFAVERSSTARLSCGLEPGRGVEICHERGSRTLVPGTRVTFPQSSAMTEVGLEGSSKTMRYDAFSPKNCVVRLNVGDKDFSAEFGISCLERLSWREVALAVETDLAAAYRSRSPAAERRASF
ncbi:MAG: hypothetical protein C0458_15420 [Methylobacterium sp.]|nr:hypothetical protein [Methylobacterium sp.]